MPLYELHLPYLQTQPRGQHPSEGSTHRTRYSQHPISTMRPFRVPQNSFLIAYNPRMRDGELELTQGQ